MEPIKDFQENMRKARKGIEDAKKAIILLGRDLCENKLRFGCEINEEIAKNITDMLIQLSIKENQFVLKEHVYSSAVNQFEKNRNFEFESEDKKVNIENYVNNLKIREWIKNNMKVMLDNNNFDPKTDDVYYRILMDLLYDKVGDEQNNDIQIERVFHIPKDPISTKQITEPVKSIRCGHVYDRTSFEEFIQKKTHIQCPVAGCPNQNISKNDVYPDEKLRLMIDLAKEKNHE